MSSCVFCGSSIKEKVYRNTLCSSCGKDLRSCLNCRHYEKGRPYECRESIHEPVSEKSRANFCDFFQINQKNSSSAINEHKRENNAKAAFDDLFGD